MKNLFALNKSKDLIHINNVDKKRKEKFHCCNCENELIARKGSVNAHHFSHKHELDCNFESYLHKLGKLQFHKEYSDCLNLKEPFYIEYSTKRTCTSCADLKPLNISCELKDKTSLFDLTKRFDKIHIEKRHNGFIADILLESSKFGEVIFVEIAVTHKCETEKINSGIRIIEINLKKESDLEFLSQRKIKLSHNTIDLYNFQINHLQKSFQNKTNCKRSFHLFSIIKNGQAVKNTMKMSEIVSDLRNREFLHCEVLNPRDYYLDETGEDCIELIEEISNKGVNVRNCHACRFLGKNRKHDQMYPFFCKRLKVEIENSNNGIYCTKFWRKA